MPLLICVIVSLALAEFFRLLRGFCFAVSYPNDSTRPLYAEYVHHLIPVSHRSDVRHSFHFAYDLLIV